MLCIPPAKELQPYVKCYWIFENPSDKSMHEQPNLPLGHQDLIINYTDYHACIEQDHICDTEKQAILGQLQSVQLDGKHTIGLFTVCFQPMGFSLLAEQSTQTHGMLPVEFETLVQALYDANNNEDRIAIANEHLSQILASNQPEERIPIRQIINRIEARKGNISIAALAHKYFCSIAKLERQFKTFVGITLREYCQMVRFKCLIAAQKSEYAQHQLGYHDQEAFMHDFQQLTGLQPQSLPSLTKKESIRLF